MQKTRSLPPARHAAPQTPHAASIAVPEVQAQGQAQAQAQTVPSMEKARPPSARNLRPNKQSIIGSSDGVSRSSVLESLSILL